MPSLILSTCGTSLLTGGGISDELRRMLREQANAVDWASMPEDVAHRLQSHAQRREEQLLSAETSEVQRMSAELNSLLSWREQQASHPQDMYMLLTTDTVLGRTVTDSIARWLEKHGLATSIMSADGLRTARLNEFRESLSELVKQLVDTLTGYQETGYSIRFNLTGGFKGLNGFLQALSTIYADQTFYLFEGSKELLFIPKLPFTLDAKKLIVEHLHAFRRLSHALPVTEVEYKKIPETLLFAIDNDIMLSEWGELLWQSSYKEIYKQQLLPSISDRVLYSDGFEASTKGLSPDIMGIVNARIADLAEYAENNCQHALKSLDPKPLQTKMYKERNLWECDLDPHHRIFMVKHGYTFILENVGKALH